MFDVPMHGWIGTAAFLATAEEIVERMRDAALLQHIAAEAVRRHNSIPPRPELPTCQQWCPGAAPLETEWVIEAVRSPRHCSADDWLAWAGDHRGIWYNARDQFIDHALWSPPIEMTTELSVPAIVQPVQCYIEENGVRVPQRRGWNATLGDREYVIGWDPKRICARADARQAVHVGFGFAPTVAGDSRHCILWVLWRESFLECVDRVARRRTSTRVVYHDRPDEVGFGQWQIASLR